MSAIEELLATVLRRQDELDTRFRALEAHLGLRYTSERGAPFDPPPAPPPLVPLARRDDGAPIATPMTWQDDQALPSTASPSQRQERAPIALTGSPLPTPGVERAPIAIGAPPMARPDPAPRGALTAARATEAAAGAPSLESQVGLRWLNRIGVVTLLLGVAFAYKTAVDNAWIGPAVQIALGVVAALGILFAGDVQWRRGHVVFAQGLTGLGIALLYVTFWAGCELYALLPQAAAFGLMVATTIGAGLLALRYASQAIAILGLLGGYVTPVALATGEPHTVFFFSYLTAQNLATLVLARRRVWLELELLAALATAILFIGWLGISDVAAERVPATVFAAVCYAQFAIARARPLASIAQLAAPLLMAVLWEEVPMVRYALLLGLAVAGLVVAARRPARSAALWPAVGFWGAVLTRWVDGPRPESAELAGVGLGFAVFVVWLVQAHLRERRPASVFDLALLVFHPIATALASARILDGGAALGGVTVVIAAVYAWLGKRMWDAADAPAGRRPAFVAFAASLAFLTVTAPLELSGFPLAIAWALEGAALAWLSRRLGETWSSVAACGVLVLAVGALAEATVAAEFDGPLALVANPRLLAFAIVAVCLFAAARLLTEPIRAGALYVVAHLVVLCALGLELSAWIARDLDSDAQPNTLTVARSVLIAAYAVLLIVLGVVVRRARDRILGLVLMAVVVIKLYASDVWELGRGFQVAAFLALGVLLLAVSYVYSRYRAVIGRLWRSDAPDGGGGFRSHAEVSSRAAGEASGP